MNHRLIGTLLALVLASVTSGCGGSDSVAATASSGSGAMNSAGAGGTGSATAGSSAAGSAGSGHPSQLGTAGMGVVVGDGKAFLPEGITYSLVEGGRALTLIASTMIDEPDGSYWVFSMRNDERDPICRPQVNAAFISANQTSDSSYGESVVAVQAAMYRSDAGDHPCLMPGEIGIAAGFVGWPETGAMKTIEIDYQPRGYLSPEAVKLPDLVIGALAFESSAAGNVVTGSVTNPTAAAVGAPVEVAIFPQDSGGRPIDFGYATSDAELAAGSSWTFTTTIPSPINKYAAFAVYGQTPP